MNLKELGDADNAVNIPQYLGISCHYAKAQPFNAQFLC
jgi:hypothetical protein